MLAAGLALELAFWPQARDLGDALNYSIGALYTHVAHPPGSVGYCLLIGWINNLIGDVRTTLILVGITISLVATVLCHRLARDLGLRGAAAVACAALYCLSVNTLNAGLGEGPHIIEGMMSLLAGLFAIRAIRDRSFGYALATTATVALAGSLRPTTTLLLAPMLVYTVWVAGSGVVMSRRAGQLAVHLALFLPICAAWSWADQYYMTLNGYGGTTYQTQVLATSSADFDSFSATTVNNQPGARLEFHMPAAEVLGWIGAKTSVRLLPRVPNEPTPSLPRAARLAVVQTIKQAWWITFSIPTIWLALLLVAFRQPLGRFPNQLIALMCWWIAPSIVFFIVGHLGKLAYIQVYLGPLCAVVAVLLLGDMPASARSWVRTSARAAVACSVAASAAFFALSRPIGATSGLRRTIDVIAIQYGGYARRTAFATSRLAGNTTSDAQSEAEREYLFARNDAELLEAARRNHFPYAIFPPEQQSSPQPASQRAQP